MKTTKAEDLALDTYLRVWDYEGHFTTNLGWISDNNKEYITIKEIYEHVDTQDLIHEIIHLAQHIQKLIDKEKGKK